MHWSKLNSLGTILIWSQINDESSCLSCSNFQTTWVTDPKLESNERYWNFLPFESNLAPVAKTSLKWKQFKGKKNTYFTLNQCYSQTV